MRDTLPRCEVCQKETTMISVSAFLKKEGKPEREYSHLWFCGERHLKEWAAKLET